MELIRDDKFLIPKKNDQLSKNDKIYVDNKFISNVRNFRLPLVIHEKISKKILIVGGGNIGLNLAKNIEETLLMLQGLKLLKKIKREQNILLMNWIIQL